MKPFFTLWRFLLLICSLLVLSIFPTQAQWKRISGPEGGLVRSLYHYNSTFFASTPSGIFRSEDNAQTWQDVNLKAVFENEATPVMSFASSGSRLYTIMFYTLYVSTDIGKTWSKIGEAPKPDYLVAQDSVLLCASYTENFYPNSSISRSTTKGNAWTTLKLNILQSAQITGLALTPTSVLVATAAHGILRSTDQGENWSILKNNLSTEPLTSLTADGSIYYAGTSYGKVFKSIDNGESWQQIASTSTNFPVSSILAHGSILYFSTLGGGLFVSTDNGLSWKECTTAPMNSNINSVVGTAPNLLAYSGQSDGIFRSITSGETWEVANKGFISHNILRVFTEADTLYTQTWKGGFYQMEIRIEEFDGKLKYHYQYFDVNGNPINFDKLEQGIKK